MKKTVIVFLTVSLMGIFAVSCDKESPANTVPTIDIDAPADLTQSVPLNVNVEVVNESAPGTKVVKTAWEAGDKILVFFNVATQGGSMYATGYLKKGYHVAMTYDGSKWSGVFMGSNNSEDIKRLGTSGTMYGVYFPFGNVSYSQAYGFQSSGHSNSALNGDIYSYYFSDETGSPYTMTYGSMATLDGKLHMSLPADFVYFYIDKQGEKFNENDKYRLSVAGIKPSTVTGWDETFSKKELGAGKPMWGFKYGDGIAFAGIKDDTWETTGRHQLILFSDGDPALTKTIKAKLASHATVKLANPLESANSWTQAITAPTYTEMGAGGLKWGNWNLGATSLNDYGTSFRWGEIVTYDGTRDNRYSAHNLTGNYAIFDAARAYLGADWRMPTRTEIDALLDGSTNSGASSGTVTAGTISRQGVKSVSKTAPANSLFFPKPDDNSSGGYWSSTAYSGSAYYYWVGSSKLMSSSGGAIATPYAIRPIYIGE